MSVSLRYLLFMKMAALQLMQQKANKENKTAAVTDGSNAEPEASPADTAESAAASEATAPVSTSEPVETPADATQTPESQPTEAETTAAATTDATAATSEATEQVETPAATTNGTPEPVVADGQGRECESPVEGKEAEENIPGLAQAKELAESLAAEDGSSIGTSKRPK